MTGTATIQNAIIDVLDGDLCLTTDQLVAATCEGRKAIPQATCKLVSRGLVERVEIGCFRLTDEGKAAKKEGIKIKCGPSGKRPDNSVRRVRKITVRQKIWRVIVNKKKVAVPDIERLIATDDTNYRNYIQRYIRALVRAGYLAELPRRAAGASLTSNGFKRYLLVRDTGHLAPIYQADKKRFHDQNTKEFFPCAG